MSGKTCELAFTTLALSADQPVAVKLNSWNGLVWRSVSSVVLGSQIPTASGVAGRGSDGRGAVGRTGHCALENLLVQEAQKWFLQYLHAFTTEVVGVDE